jgi:hypothetical protein
MSKIDILHEVDLTELKPCPKNIFSHEYNISDIIASIRDFGYNKVSIGIDEDNLLLYGHGTLEAIQILGWKTAPMVARISGLTEEQKKSYRIADNTSAFRSVIIKEMLREELSTQATFDFADYGMPMAEILNANNDTPGELDATAASFNKDNPNIPKKEKMWMYIEFNSMDDWQRAIDVMAKGGSRRILDEDKFMEVINGKM